MTITAGASRRRVHDATSFTYPRSGKTVTRAGRAIIYTGFQWRGRSTVGGDDATSLREVMFVERDWQHDVGPLVHRRLRRDGRRRAADARRPRARRARPRSAVDQACASAAQDVRIYGANLPATHRAERHRLRARRDASRASCSATPTLVTVRRRRRRRRAGRRARSRSSSGVVSRAAVAVYDKIDYIKVTPRLEHGARRRRRVSEDARAVRGDRLQQRPRRQAGHQRRPRRSGRWTRRGRSRSTGDLRRRRREVRRRDRSAAGSFTPALDGPNPARSGNRNNVGDVWVVATVPAPQGAAPRRCARARTWSSPCRSTCGGTSSR